MNAKIRLRPSITGLLLTIAILFSGAISESEAAPGGSPERGALNSMQEVLIGFNETPGAAEEALVRAFGGDVRRTFWLIPVIAANLPDNAIAALEATPNVRYVELNGPVYASEQKVPWGIDRLFNDGVSTESHLFSTWATSTGNGVGVAILDTGIDPRHEDLNVKGGTSMVGGNWTDRNGHGTHVAGTVAALDNGVGVVGVAPDADLYAVKVLNNNGSGSLDNVIAGIQWAVGQKDNISILNMSLGTSSHYQSFEDACDAADAAGLLLVAAAGNSGTVAGDDDSVEYPARYKSVIAVAASDFLDERAWFSSTGGDVELIAPGVEVWSTTPGNGYSLYSGTSMSSPHVAGVAALIWAAKPYLSNVDVRDILELSAQDLSLNPLHQGIGLVRADKAVALALEHTGGAAVIVSVETLAASGISDTMATLKGDLTALTGATQADVSFQYRSQNETSWFKTTPVPSGTGTFEQALNGLAHSTTYEFQALAAANGTADTGSIFSFKTDATSGGDVGTSLEIDLFEVTDASNRQWTRAEVSWTVSGGSGNKTVTTELLVNGSSVDFEKTIVTGSAGSGTDDLRTRNRDGSGYTVSITVRDEAGTNIENIFPE